MNVLIWMILGGEHHSPLSQNLFMLHRSHLLRWSLRIRMNHLDEALAELSDEELREYEEAIELWITYGGD